MLGNAYIKQNQFLHHRIENTKFTEVRLGICKSTLKSPPLTLLADDSLASLLSSQDIRAHSAFRPNTESPGVRHKELGN